MTSLLLVVALLLSMAAFLTFFFSLADGEPIGTVLALLLVIVAVPSWIGFAHYNHLDEVKADKQFTEDCTKIDGQTSLSPHLCYKVQDGKIVKLPLDYDNYPR